MTQTLPAQKLFTFDEFVSWYPNNGKRYELHNRAIIEMPPPTGDHESVIGFLAGEISVEYKRLKLPYFIPKSAFVKTPLADSAYLPDILLLNSNNLINEPRWKKESTVTQATSVPLIVEVVSTNWRDDYYDKFGDYEEMGILEYWIVDYAANGGRKFIGNPKQPTIFVCELVDGEYQMHEFRNDERIVSPTFPQLNLTANQIFSAGIEI
jgi:Uma2 family endonuclease